MNRNSGFFTTGTWAALLLAFSAGCGIPRGTKEDAPKVQKIPLKSVYSTSGQKGLEPVSSRANEAYANPLKEIAREFRAGASNLVLVRGKDIGAAVMATQSAFTSSPSPDVPIDPEDGWRNAPLWLAAYLGTGGSDPPAWRVQSVERRGTTFRLTYRKGLAKGKDSRQHFVWAPLGQLDPGRYTLELFDAEAKEVTFLRRVTVPERKEEEPDDPPPGGGGADEKKNQKKE